MMYQNLPCVISADGDTCSKSRLLQLTRFGTTLSAMMLTRVYRVHAGTDLASLLVKAFPAGTLNVPSCWVPDALGTIAFNCNFNNCPSG